MDIKVDENVPDSVAEILRASQHDVERARDEGLTGATDEEVLTAATETGRVLVTLDLDFADVVRHPPEKTPGIVVLRPRVQTLDLMRQVATVAGTLLNTEEVAGRLWIVERSRVRVWPGA